MNQQIFDISDSVVILRKLKITDKNHIMDLLSDPDVMAYIGPRRPMKEDEIDKWLVENIEKYEFGWNRWAVAFASNDEFIGMVGIQPDKGKYDFGYYFRRCVWGKGVAKRSVKLAIDLIHSNDIEIEAFIAESNMHSTKLAEAIGLQKKETTIKDGEIGFCYYFGYRANDQSARKASP